MGYQGIREGLLSRLIGTHGLVAPLAGGRGKGMKAAGLLLYPQAPLDTLRKVPVVPYDIAGRGATELPVVTVYLAGPPQPRRDASYVADDPIMEDVQGSSFQTTFDDGEIVSGAGFRKVRPHPRPVTYRFTLRVYASSEEECALIFERLLDLLEERGYLTVKLHDGSTTTYDTSMDDSPISLDVPEGLLGNTDTGEFSMSTTYTVEGYLDTTDQKELVRTIRERTIEAGTDDTDEPLTTTYEPDTTVLKE